jgi:hypothetical protein
MLAIVSAAGYVTHAIPKSKRSLMRLLIANLRLSG